MTPTTFTDETGRKWRVSARPEMSDLKPVDKRVGYTYFALEPVPATETWVPLKDAVDQIRSHCVRPDESTHFPRRRELPIQEEP